MNTNQVTNDFVIKSYSRKELRHLYGISHDVFAKWLKPYEEVWELKGVRQFSPDQVSKIVSVYGPPFIRIKMS